MIRLSQEQYDWYTNLPSVVNAPYKNNYFQCTELSTEKGVDFTDLGKDLKEWSKRHNRIFEGESVCR